ncbi:MAG TPA: glycoside hydrolase family 3 C-terminal domain-containing protein, partial [Polyangiaceae bacterium]|nr:glycoside hydrolase family 3 C-terminal domain-containing protein [Polyangiaceae bacterium]
RPPPPEAVDPPFLFRDPDAPSEERIDDLLSRMTLDEKIACLGTDPSVPRLGVRGSDHVEGLHGLALGGPGRWGGDRPVPTTTFPQAYGLAQTWDPDLLREVAEIEANEARYAFQSPRYGRGGLVVRAPNADIGRDPRWGRTEECYGEDPYLCGVMAAAFVRGLQGEHPRYWRAAALLKHFFANSTEDGRERSSADFDEALFYEYYGVAFRAAIREGGSRAHMAAYNAHNGVPCTTHPFLAEVAAADWGQDGIICTDANALQFLVTAHRRYPDLYEAAAAAVRAGITQFLDDHREPVRGALERGLLAEADVDRAVRCNFRVMIRLGLLDPPALVPYARIGAGGEPEPWDSEAHRSAVLRATRASIVLLKSERGLLPLDRTTLRSIAVVGPLADRVLVDWYSGTPPYVVTPLDGIRRKLDGLATVRSATNNDDSDAVRIARECEACVVFVGSHPTGDAGWAQVSRASYGKEAVDRRSLDLEDEQLVRRVLAANPRTVVVLIASFPYCIAWTQENAPAIVHVTHNSQELGAAVADVLFGDHNPAGRLVQTWPRSIDALPPMSDYDVRRGRTYRYFEGDVLYPFGHGLSYSTFRYVALRAGADASAGAPIPVTADVSNTSGRAGDEVVQLYARYADPARPGPRLALVGFRRVHLQPGETRSVVIGFNPRDLARWDERRRRLVVDEGRVELMVGGSSARLEQRVVVTLRAPALGHG